MQLAQDVCSLVLSLRKKTNIKVRQPLGKVMTPEPICIKDDALAVEALKIFNERNIDDLIVVNEKNEPVGIVDSQDLTKLKLL